MTKCVTEVEQGTSARLTLVFLDNGRLRPAASLNCLGPRRATGKDVAPVHLKPLEEVRIAQQPIFHNFRVAGPKLPFRQRFERLGVNDHEPRLVEGANKVFALSRIDAGFPAHRRIDLGEEGRGNLHEIDPSAQDARGKAGKIADYAAAKRDNQVAAFNSEFQQTTGKRFKLGKAFCRLPGSESDVAGHRT